MTFTKTNVASGLFLLLIILVLVKKRGLESFKSFQKKFKLKTNGLAVGPLRDDFHSTYQFGLDTIESEYEQPTVIKSFIDSDQVERLKQAALKKGLVDSQVKAGIVDDKSRTSQQTWLFLGDDPIVQEIFDKKEEILGVTGGSDAVQVVKYEPGGFFIPHQDQCESHENWCVDTTHDRGPRWTNFLLYLNNDFEGGETTFPELGITVKPKPGDGLLFNMLNKEGTMSHPLALHGGKSVTKGEKWIANVWTRKSKTTVEPRK